MIEVTCGILLLIYLIGVVLMLSEVVREVNSIGWDAAWNDRGPFFVSIVVILSWPITFSLAVVVAGVIALYSLTKFIPK